MNRISDVVVLPDLGRAIFNLDGVVSTLSAEVGEPEAFCFERFSCVDFSEVFGISIPDGTDLESIRSCVSVERDRTDLVFFFLASLDRTMSLETREAAASFVEDLLDKPGLQKYAKEILLTESFQASKDASLEGSFPSLERYAGLIDDIAAHQSAIKLFWRGWDALVADVDSLTITFDLHSLRDVLLRSGFLTKFVQCIYAADLMSFNREVINFTLLAEVKAEFRVASQLLNTLKNRLVNYGAFKKRQSNQISETDLAFEASGRPTNSQYVRQLASHEVYEQVTKQIESIKSFLFAGSQSMVSKALRELLAFQRNHSEDEYLAKTLCNLAGIALDANEAHIAKELSDEAIGLGVEDVVIPATAAEVMKHLGRFEKAKTLYEDAITKYGRERYLINGLAEVLKESGQFHEAMAQYEKIEREFPDDPVASNGISTVLFAMGSPEKALAKAKQNIGTFGDLVSRIVCGNILRHLGRNHESLTLMRETTASFPKESSAWIGLIRSLSLVGRFDEALKECDSLVVRLPGLPFPQVLRGEILKNMGKLDESLSSYNKSLEIFPFHRGLLIGKATVLVLLGNSDEAAEMMKPIEVESELDWRAFHVWASAFIRQKDYQRALATLEWGLENVPWHKMRSLFSDSIGYVRLRMGDASTAIEQFREGLKTADVPKRNGLFLLLSRACSDMGRSADSQRYLQKVVSNDPPVIQLKSAIPRLRSANGEAIDLDSFERNEFQMLFATAA